MLPDNILVINKPLGITSYDVIRELKKKFPGQKIGHAGTLDPLASGVLICLIGNEANKRQHEFLCLDKEYEFDVLFGFKTDTYDILGKVLQQSEYDPKVKLKELRSKLYNYTGIIKQSVPSFSAVKIKGKPLYRWFLDGKIDQVEIPVKVVEVKSIEILESRIISMHVLRGEIFTLLNLVKSGFRNHEIKVKWGEVLSTNTVANLNHTQGLNEKQVLTVKLRGLVSKGTYVRAIANDIGNKLGVGACTLSIRRTRVGGYYVT